MISRARRAGKGVASSTIRRSAASSFRCVLRLRCSSSASGGSSTTRSRTCAARTSRPASASCAAAPASTSRTALIEYSSEFDLRPRASRRLPEHAARRRRRHHHGDDPRLPRRHRPAVAQLADRARSRPSMSRSSATSRRCWSSSSGISACWRCCRRRATASSCRSARISTIAASISRARSGATAPG